MSLIRINHHPSRRELKLFGGLWMLFFAALGAVIFARSGMGAGPILLWAIAILAPGVGWLFPSLMRRLYVAMCYAALPIGWVVSHLLLAAIYFGVMTPTGWLLKALRHDPLSRRMNREQATYWIERETNISPARYYRQF